MNYSNIIECDTNNGDHFRVSLFVSGCTLNCPNCHNKEQQKFDYGTEYTKETEDYIIELLSKTYIGGLSLLGGEPILNLDDGWLLSLVKRAKKTYPNKTIYLWSGFYFSEIVKDAKAMELMKYIDMFRGGRYVHNKRDLKQYLQGSSNQSYTDVRKSLEKGEEVEYSFKRK